MGQVTIDCRDLHTGLMAHKMWFSIILEAKWILIFCSAAFFSFNPFDRCLKHVVILKLNFFAKNLCKKKVFWLVISSRYMISLSYPKWSRNIFINTSNYYIGFVWIFMLSCNCSLWLIGQLLIVHWNDHEGWKFSEC